MVNILISRKSKLLEEKTVKLISPFIKSEDKLIILGFSFFEKDINSKEAWINAYGKESTYYKECELIFTNLGVKKENITWLNYYEDTKLSLIENIKQANILFIPGGAPDQMMERIHEKEITDVLKEFKGLVIGSSAGAMIQFDYFHISKDRDYDAFNVSDGLGYLKDFSIEVHYKRKKVQKSGMKKAVKLFKRTLYTLPDDAIIICYDNTIKALDGARIMYEKGKRVN